MNQNGWHARRLKKKQATAEVSTLYWYGRRQLVTIANNIYLFIIKLIQPLHSDNNDKDYDNSNNSNVDRVKILDYLNRKYYIVSPLLYKPAL